MCNEGITQFYLPPTPAFTPQLQDVTALWPVLIAPTHEGMARLSWPVWLVTYRSGIEPGQSYPSQY